MQLSNYFKNCPQNIRQLVASLFIRIRPISLGLISVVLAFAFFQNGGWAANAQNNRSGNLNENYTIFGKSNFRSTSGQTLSDFIQTPQPGSLDTTFARTGKTRFGFGMADDGAKTAIVQADGKVLVAGFARAGGVHATVVSRYEADGSLDPTFGIAGSVYITVSSEQISSEAVAIALQPVDGKIVVGSNCNNGSLMIIRLNLNGSLDSTFGRRLIPIVGSLTGLAVLSDGKIIVSGHATSFGQTDFVLFRLLSNGPLDTTFSGDGKVVQTVGDFDYSTSLLVQPDEKLVVAGYTRPDGGTNTSAILRFLPNGDLDPTFGGTGVVKPTILGADHVATSISFQSTPPSIIASINSQQSIIVAKVATDGNYSLSSPIDFGETNSDSTSLFVQDLGGGSIRYFVSGTAYTGSTRYFAALRLDENFAYDNSFDNDGRVKINVGGSQQTAMAAGIASGKYTITGYSSYGNFPGFPAFSDTVVTRLNYNGSSDSTFDGDGMRVDDLGNFSLISNTFFQFGPKTSAFGFTPSGNLIVAGGFIIGQIRALSVARLTPDGNVDRTFGNLGRVAVQTPLSYSGTPLAPADSSDTIYQYVFVQPDEKIVVVGNDRVNGMLARFNPDGTLDTTFSGDGFVVTPNLPLRMAKLLPNGKIVAVGNTAIGAFNTWDFSAIRFNSDGSRDGSFGDAGVSTIAVGADADWALSLSVDSNERILLAGRVERPASTSGIQGDCVIVRLLGNGSLDSSFDGDGFVVTSIRADQNDQFVSVTTSPDNKIVAAGKAVYGTGIDAVVVRYNPDGSLDTTFGTGGVVTKDSGHGDDDVSGVLVQNNRKIVVTGNDPLDLMAFRLNADGSVDQSFGNAGSIFVDIIGGLDYASIASFDQSGRVVIVGSSYDNNGRGEMNTLIRLNGDPAATVQAPFDFDGDSKTDLSIFRPGQGEWWVSKSSNGGNFATQFGTATDTVVPADFTGDGKTDVAYWRPSTGFWYVLRSEDFTFYAFPFGAGGDVPVPADFDGDGKADAGVFRPSAATWYISRSSGGTMIQQFGLTTDKPVPADYDGDGKADLAVYRPTGANGAEWWISKSSGGTFATQFGSSTDKAVPADYTGDGKADVAFWIPSTGQWFILRSEDLTYYAFPFGGSGDAPVPGDYDGDGKMDAAVFRPSNSTWHANRSTAGVLIQQFGQAGDVPLPNAFVR